MGVLYPTVSFKNVSVHLNFGPEPLAPLPFRCHMFQDAASSDATVLKEEKPKDGKYELVMPVGLPDEGIFDWVNMFLEKNPGFTELSDRAILSWAEKSGVWRPKGFQARTNNDKPDMAFGIQQLDDLTVRRVMHTVATAQPRNY